MPSTPALLGIDLGTSSVKAVLTEPDGTIRARAAAAYGVERPHPHWAQTDPRAWWRAIRDSLARLRTDPAWVAPSGIGLSGQMHGVVLCDAAGAPVHPALLWCDARATAELQEYRGLPPASRRRLANPLAPGMAGPLLAWLHRHEPDAVAAADRALQPKDWVRARLTGRAAAEPSDASGTLLYEVLTGGWHEAAVAALGLRPELLADILAHSAVPAGALLPGPAHQLGLPPGIPVAAGAADTAAAALGAGLEGSGTVQLTIGTGVQIVGAAPPPTPGTLPEHPVTHLYRDATEDGWYALAASLTGGQALTWVAGVLGADWAELYAAADRDPRPDDPLFLPHLAGERTPYLDAGLRGAWTGLAAHHDRAALLYAALEGVAFAAADALDALAPLPRPPRPLRLAGGGTTVPAWRRLLSDALDAPLDAVEAPEASARGAALLAAAAAGLAAGRRPTAVTRVAEPGPRRAVLADRRRRYRATLQALAGPGPHGRSTAPPGPGGGPTP